ncbi:MAG TPA: adenylate/guanylate cyclase domain-containing protein [Gallionella sp.]
MEERSNKTIMCSVLFLDIVEYSRKSVSGQISLKDRFNSYLSAAIRDVPITDRIILDTGDGAAINFLGDVEDALKAALSLRESLLNEDPNVDHPLQVRMGINLGPVRLVRDINGQPNIVGDGINVAQRVMGFADSAQILVSRSYYDAVSRLSPQYAGMFHYQGSRTDKHVREHEVYAIGYPGDKTTLRSRSGGHMVARHPSGSVEGTVKHFNNFLYAVGTLLLSLARESLFRFQRAQTGVKIVYIVVIAAPVLLLALLAGRTGDDAKSMHDKGEILQTPVAGSRTAEPEISSTAKTTDPKRSAAAVTKPKTQDKPTSSTQSKKSQGAKSGDNKARISVSCTAGTEVFVDGVRLGGVGSKTFLAVIPQGRHNVIVSHPSGGIYSKDVNLENGKTVEVRPDFCK